MSLTNRVARTVGAASLSLAILLGSIAINPAATYAAPVVAAGGKAIVTNTDGDNIRVRSGAGTNFPQVAEAHEGEIVAVLDGPEQDARGNRWFKVDAPGGAGWISSDFLAEKEAPAKQADPATTAKVAEKPAPKLTGYAAVGNSDGDPVRVRTSANAGGKIIAKLAPGAVVAIKDGPVVDSDGISWYSVDAGDIAGWMMAQYLIQADAPAAKVEQPAASEEARTGTSRGAEQPAASEASGLGETIVSTAMKYVGSRYVFGGTTPRGFDCSGFVYYVVNKSGYKIGRVIENQITSGPRVSADNLKPGDLLFFSNTYKRGLSHAGIYIGNGKFVHAENESTGVTVSALWSAYWGSHYTAAVRPGW